MKANRIIEAERALDRAVIAIKLFANPADLAALRDAQQIIQEVRHFAVMTDSNAPFSQVQHEQHIDRLIDFLVAD